MLEVMLFGTPSIRLDQKPVTLPFMRAEALLYYMLVQKSATRAELAALLWEDFDEATGMKNLRNTLYSLKKALGPDILLSPRKSVVILNPDVEIACDYDGLFLSEDPDIYRGEFLQGFGLKRAFAFEEWIRETREKAREKFLTGLWKRAEKAEDPEETVLLARRYLREDPFHEPVNCLLMKALGRTGQYEKAASVYQTLRKNLLKELGIAPQDSTTKLYYQIMNRWNALAGENVRSGRPLPPVGREVCSERLRKAAELVAARGIRQAFLISGEAGSGKSELIRYFLRWTDLSGCCVVREECLQSEEQFSLLPWKRIVRKLWDMALEEGLALPIAVQNRLEETFLREDGRKGSTFAGDRGDLPEEETSVLLDEMSGRKKLLIILENVQWMDTDSAALLTAALETMGKGGMLVILSCRDDFDFAARRTLLNLEQGGKLARMKLQPLSREETAVLVRRELDDHATDALTEAFYRETGGNLTLLEELIRRTRMSGNGEVREPSGILAACVLQLPDYALNVARILSLFPEQVSGRMLQRLTGGDDRMLSRGLENLRQGGIIEEHHAGREDYYRFRMSRIREIVYDTTSARERRPVYEKAARILAEDEARMTGADCRKAARYFELSGSPAEALRYRIRAAALDNARAFVPFARYGGSAPLFADRIASEQETRTLRAQMEELLVKREKLPEDDMEMLLTVAAGEAALFGGDPEQGMRLLGEISEGSGNPGIKMLSGICYMLAQFAVYRQAPGIAERYVATGMQLLGREQGGSPWNILSEAGFRRLRGCCFCLRKSYDKASYYHLDAIDTLERMPRSTEVRLQLAAAYGDLARVFRHKNGYADACAYFRKAEALLSDGPWPGKTWLLVHYGRTVFALEDHRKAENIFRDAFRTSEENGELCGRCAAASYMAYYSAQDGDWEEAARYLLIASEAADRVDSSLERGILCFVSMALRRTADRTRREKSIPAGVLGETADQYARQGLRYFKDIPDVFEADLIARALREGISTKTSFRASELYSRNRHSMTE